MTRDTASNEAFDPLFLGFYDWGTWWQGEIAGEYFLSNSNLKSHLVRAHVAPSDADQRRPDVLQFHLRSAAVGRPRGDVYGRRIRDRCVRGLEAERQLHRQPARRVRRPGKAVEQATGRTKNFAYGMVYVGYSF